MSASTDLASEALQSVAETDEVERSEKVAETLNALQGVIERNARELIELNKNLKEKREMLKNALENNTEINEALAKAKQVTDEIKEKKAKAGNDPAVVNLKLQVAEMAQNKKEVEETLSSHLVNYHQLTGSTSFDTTDGDQWEFSISARVKSRKQ
jgi:ABC-type transporter Mla subunit MlaD